MGAAFPVLPHFSSRYVNRHLELADLPVSLIKHHEYDVRRFVSLRCSVWSLWLSDSEDN